MRMIGWVLAVAVVTAAPLAGTPAYAQAKKAPAKSAKAAEKKYDEKQLTALEVKLKKSPKDAKLKTEVAEASFQVGFAMMNNPDLPPRMKYPGALKHYNRSLELNPKHVGAAKNKKLIEDIYKSLGRPVPG